MSTRRRGATTVVAVAAAAAGVGLASTPASGVQAPAVQTSAVQASAAQVSAARAAAAALPVVNHERLLLAAQLDPSKPGRGLTSGAEASVKTVKKALIAKGLLASSDTDGHFGIATMNAWRSWENRVHTSSHAWSTNGLPSLFELNKLAVNRFTVGHKVDQGSWVVEAQNDAPASFRDQHINQRTRAMFHKAEQLSGSNMTISQGRGGASTSAGTHLGGGVIDIRVVDNPSKTSARVAALRKVGFAAWYRNWSGNQHIHAIAVGDPWVAYGAHRSLCQVFQFRFGGEGLSCSNSTSGADRPLIWWEQYKRSL